MNKNLKLLLIKNNLLDYKYSIKESSFVLENPKNIFLNINQYTKLIHFVKNKMNLQESEIIFSFFDDYSKELFSLVSKKYEKLATNVISANFSDTYTKVSKRTKLIIFFGKPSIQLTNLCFKNDIFLLSVVEPKYKNCNFYTLPFNINSLKKALWFMAYFKSI